MQKMGVEGGGGGEAFTQRHYLTFSAANQKR